MHTLPYPRKPFFAFSDLLNIPSQQFIPLVVLFGIALIAALGLELKQTPTTDELAMLQRLAKDNNDGAQLQLGLAYREGRLGVTANADQASYWIAQAASHGNLYAQQLLGHKTAISPLEQFGAEFSRVLTSHSFDSLKAKARAGDHQAQFELALRYRDGIYGVNKDELQSQLWLKRAAAGGHAIAQQMLKSAQVTRQ